MALLPSACPGSGSGRRFTVFPAGHTVIQIKPDIVILHPKLSAPIPEHPHAKTITESLLSVKLINLTDENRREGDGLSN